MAIASSIKQSGAQSFTVFTSGGAGSVTLGVAQFAALPAGKLKSLISAQYATFAAFVEAAAEAGILTATSSNAANATTTWGITAEPGTPTLICTLAGPNDVSASRVAASYSASE